MLAHGSADQTNYAYDLLEFADERHEASQYLSGLIDRLAASVVEKKVSEVIVYPDCFVRCSQRGGA